MMNGSHVIQSTIAAVRPLDETAMAAARSRQAQLTKPAGAFGELERLSIRIAGIAGRLDPPLARKEVILCAADHGVVAENVSAYPAAVTAQMVHNFLAGGAAINVLARQMGAGVTVVDMGVAAELPIHKDLICAKVACGTRNIAREAAMGREQALQSMAAGIRAVGEIAGKAGLELVVLGEMGIGNTTAAAAIAAAITGRDPAEVTGRGTGIDEARHRHKIAVIERTLACNRPDPEDAVDVLARVGGFEIGGLAGVCLAAAAHRMPVLVDGLIATSAALLAATLAPAVKPYLIAAHLSREPGHAAMLDHLGLRPLLDLDMALGEGTGGVMAIPVVEAAVATLNEMTTFDSASVAHRVEGD